MTAAPMKPSEALRTSDLGVYLWVWWIPQVPMKSFNVTIDSIQQGRFLLKALAEYDLFQLENRVKPDFCNAGGIAYKHPSLTEGEWWDFPDDDDEVEDLVRDLLQIREVAA